MANGHPPNWGVPPLHDPLSFPSLSSHTAETSKPIVTPNTAESPKAEPSKLTYADCTRSQPFVPADLLPKLPNVTIKTPVVTIIEGVKAIIFQEEEITASKQAFRFALVVNFHGERPPVDKFDKFVNTQWGLTETAVVGLLDPRHIMVRMENEADFIKAWTKEDCFFNTSRFTLTKWSEDFMVNKETRRAVWIELRKLPIQFQLPDFLEQIGNNIGRFLKIDDRTRVGKHPIAPRLCVELDLSKSLPESIWVGYITKEGNQVGHLQSITYDFSKSKCLHCKHFGHENPQCPKRENSNKVLLKIRPSFPSAGVPSSLNTSHEQPMRAWVKKAATVATHAHSKVPNFVPPISVSDYQENQGPNGTPVALGDILDNMPKENVTDLSSQEMPPIPIPIKITQHVPPFEETSHILASTCVGDKPAPTPYNLKLPTTSANVVEKHCDSMVPPSFETNQHSLHLAPNPQAAQLKNTNNLGDHLDFPPKEFLALTNHSNVPTVTQLEPSSSPSRPFAYSEKPTPEFEGHLSHTLDHSICHFPTLPTNVNHSPPNARFSLEESFKRVLSKQVGDHCLNPKAVPYHSNKVDPAKSFVHANRFDVLSRSVEINHALVPFKDEINRENIPNFVEPLQAIPYDKAHHPIDYGPLIPTPRVGGISWHDERRNYSKDKITIASLFKVEENQIVTHASPAKPTATKEKKRKNVSWKEGDIQSAHIFEHDIEDSIEDRMIRLQGKPTIKTFKYSKAYRMEGAKHVAWASKYFRDRVNFIDEMDQRQLEFWENHYV